MARRTNGNPVCIEAVVPARPTASLWPTLKQWSHVRSGAALTGMNAWRPFRAAWVFRARRFLGGTGLSDVCCCGTDARKAPSSLHLVCGKQTNGPVFGPMGYSVGWQLRPGARSEWLRAVQGSVLEILLPNCSQSVPCKVKHAREKQNQAKDAPQVLTKSCYTTIAADKKSHNFVKQKSDQCNLQKLVFL